MASVVKRHEAQDEHKPGQQPWYPTRVVYTGGPPESDPRRLIPELGFRDYWYPLLGRAEVSRHKPRMVKLLGEELCVFWGVNGVAAVSNFCPHRGARISGGDCHYAGTVTCPYHGFTYDEMGACVAALPEGPESRMPGKIRARSFPTRTIKDIVFVWMGDGEQVPAESDLGAELFDDSFVQHDTTIWRCNWRPALENLQDAHAPYVHRNAIRMLNNPILKRSFAGARPLYAGGGARLSHYTDGKRKDSPYQEYFSGVDGYWPKHRWRLLWTWLFKASWQRRPHQGTGRASYLNDPEWGNGPHMPGMQRIDNGWSQYTRWCVPVDANTTRVFNLHATRPPNGWARLRDRVLYPIRQRWLQYRDFGGQDDRTLVDFDFTRPEHFSEFDVETMGWRTLAILSAQYGGRHDRIPSEVIERLNERAGTTVATSARNGT
jgi:nitrite reductase/ring-hydroxylating ferredoxin subunit